MAEGHLPTFRLVKDCEVASETRGPLFAVKKNESDALVCTHGPLDEGKVVLIKIEHKLAPYLDRSASTFLKIGLSDSEPQPDTNMDDLPFVRDCSYHKDPTKRTNFKNLSQNQTLGFMLLLNMVYIFIDGLLREMFEIIPALPVKRVWGIVSFDGCFNTVLLSLKNYRELDYFCSKTVSLKPSNVKLEIGTPVSLYACSTKVAFDGYVWVNVPSGEGGLVECNQLKKSKKGINHDKFKEAMALGVMNCTIINVVCVGPPGVGKTCLKHLLLEEPLPVKRSSTPIVSPVARINVMKQRGTWSSFDEDEMTKLVAREAKEQINSPTGSLQSNCSVVNPPIPKKMSRPIRSSSSPAMLSQSLSLDEKPADPMTRSVPIATTSSNTEKQVINVMSLDSASNGDQSKDFLYFLDSGGQPQFLDLLPIFIRSCMVVIFVFDVTKDLDEQLSFSYFEEGEDKSHELYTTMPQSCCEMLENTARVVSSLSTSEDSSSLPVLLVVGTHIDKLKDKKERIKRINQKLKEKLSSLNERRIDYNEKKDEILFPIDILRDRDKMGAEIRKKLIKLSSQLQRVQVPLAWYQYERLLNKYSSDNKTSIITLSRCVELGKQMHLGPGEVENILAFFDSVNTVLYHSNEKFSIVITDPQLALGMLTSLLKITFSKTDDLALPLDSIRKLTESGLFSEEVFEICLKKHYLTHFIPEFGPSDLLQLLVDLLVIADTTYGYFIPSALPICSKNIDVSTYTTHFDCLLLLPVKGVVLQGVFTALVTHLLGQDSKFTLPEPEVMDRQQYRNAVSLVYKSGCVLIVDRFRWLELYYSGSNDKEAFNIRRTVTSDSCLLALSGVSGVLPYSVDDIRFKCGFMCDLHKDDELACSDTHPARVDMDTITHCSFSLNCTKHPALSRTCGSVRRLPWLFSLDNFTKPDIRDCMAFVGHKLGNDHFHQFGIHLNIALTEIAKIQEELQNTEGRYALLFDKWEKTGCSPYTWETIINALKAIKRMDIHNSLITELMRRKKINLE